MASASPTRRVADEIGGIAEPSGRTEITTGEAAEATDCTEIATGRVAEAAGCTEIATGGVAEAAGEVADGVATGENPAVTVAANSFARAALPVRSERTKVRHSAVASVTLLRPFLIARRG